MQRQRDLAAAIRDRLGPGAVIDDPDLVAPALTDWRGRYHGAAAAILAPATTAEAATVVAMAAAARVALVPQGGNSSMVGGATPPADGSALVLSTRRLNRIRGIDAAAGLAIGEAGVVLANLHEAVLAHGWRFPLTLGARGTATIGGLAATNAGGTQVLRFGTMRALVAGVEAVLPDGSVFEGLAALKKDNRGYDVKELLVGAEGTLGLITAATLRLVPAVGARAVGWGGLADPAAALALLRRAERGGVAVESFELIPRDSLDLVLRHLPHARAPLGGTHAWHVLIEVTAPVGADDPARVLEHLLAQAIDTGLAADAVIAANETQAEAFWTLRDSISAAERASGPAAQHDISVPVAAMPDFILGAVAACEARFPGTSATGFGHLGDGNVHFHVRAPQGVDAARWYAEQAPEISCFVNDLVVAHGGSISAEHGIGQMKIDELARLAPPSRIAVLRAVKSALDPLGLMNPGKLVPLAPPRATP